MIQVSDNTATNLLIDALGMDAVQVTQRVDDLLAAERVEVEIL